MYELYGLEYDSYCISLVRVVIQQFPYSDWPLNSYFLSFGLKTGLIEPVKRHRVQYTNDGTAVFIFNVN